MAPLKTVILCGGKGTRAYPHTTEVPKPLLEVAGRPILQHVMEIYAGQGFRSFVLSAGFKADMIRSFASGMPSEWEIEVVDTGQETNTGGRVVGVKDMVGDTFFATYSDGLGNLDLNALLAFHQAHEGSATKERQVLPLVLARTGKPVRANPTTYASTIDTIRTASTEDTRWRVPGRERMSSQSRPAIPASSPPRE